MNSEESISTANAEDNQQFSGYEAFKRKMSESNKDSKFSTFVHGILSTDGVTVLNQENPSLHQIASSSKENPSDALNGFLPHKNPSRRKVRHSLSLPGKLEDPVLGDIPNLVEPHGPEIINGVESEEVEEVNDAYNDLINDLGEKYIDKMKTE